MKNVIFSVFVVGFVLSVMFAPVAEAETKVYVCPLYASIGEDSPAIDDNNYEEIKASADSHEKALKESPKLKDLIAKGYEVMNLESFQDGSSTIHRVTLKKKTEEKATAPKK